MSLEYWQAGGIPPSTIRGGGNAEYWQAGGIPAMQATPVFALLVQNTLHEHTAGNLTLTADEPATGGFHSMLFPAPFTWWPRRFGE